MISISKTYFFIPTLLVFTKFYNLIKANVYIVSKEGLIPIVSSFLLASLLSTVLFTKCIKDRKKAILANLYFLGIFFYYGDLFNMMRTSFTSIGDIFIHMICWFWIVAFPFAIAKFLDEQNRKDILKFSLAYAVLISGYSTLTIAKVCFKEAQKKKTPLENIFAETNVGVSNETLGEEAPDIYYLVVDGYAREDFLQKYFDHDNSPFLNELRQRGFFIADKAKSNYNATYASLSSTLNLQHVGETNLSYRKLSEHISDNATARYLQGKGYQYITVNTSYAPTQNSKIADIRYQIPLGNEFLSVVLEDTLLECIMPNFAEVNHHVLDSLHDVVRHKEPKFVFAHLTLPHSPYIFDENGQELGGQYEIYAKQIRHTFSPDNPEKKNYGYVNNKLSTYVDQMKYTNKELLKVIDHINSNSKVKPIIILQSDHGWCQESVAPATAQYFEQRFPILNTWQVPDSVKKQLTSDICSVNTFRVLFSALYGENLPLIENTQYYVDESTLPKVPAEFQDLN